MRHDVIDRYAFPTERDETRRFCKSTGSSRDPERRNQYACAGAVVSNGAGLSVMNGRWRRGRPLRGTINGAGLFEGPLA